MTPNFVNQKTIDGVTYTAYRHIDNGVRIEYITAVSSLSPEAKSPNIRIKEVWNDPVKLKALFGGNK